MKTVQRILCFVATLAIFAEACHYGWPPPDPYNGSRRKRDLETEILESQNLRIFFQSCLTEHQNSGKWDFQTLTDVTVLDSDWYDKTASTECSEYTENDNADCWKSALAFYLNGHSQLMQATHDCIDQYFEDFDATHPARKKRQLSSLVNNLASNLQIAPLCIGEWTIYYSRDGPGGSGDYETLSNLRRENPGQICESPSAVDARVVRAHTHYRATGEIYTISPSSGFTCINSQQSDRRCLDYEVRFCCPNNNGRWGGWRSWSACSQTCGTGQRTRTRRCIPSSANCAGSSTENGACSIQRCQGDFTPWTSWSTCSGPCGSDGTQSRRRSCIRGTCVGRRTQERICTNNCPIGNWRRWAPWSTCSRSCGLGTRNRVRTCNGFGCNGDNLQTEDCLIQPCRTSGNWRRWGPWSTCSRSCGPGTRNRVRMCNGFGCNGDNLQTGDCLIQPCPTDRCASLQDHAHSCRLAIQLCSTSNPTYLAFIQLNCARTCCYHSSTGDWSNWGHWSRCSRTCNTGYQHSVRSCSQESTCPGRPRRVRPCNTRDCEGDWSYWSSWTSCSRTCNSGMRTRNRSCSPRGSRCSGRAAELEACATHRCFGSVLDPVFPPSRLEIQQCVRTASRTTLPSERSAINYRQLDRFIRSQVDCRLWTSLRIVQYNELTLNLERTLSARNYSLFQASPTRSKRQASRLSNFLGNAIPYLPNTTPHFVPNPTPDYSPNPTPDLGLWDRWTVSDVIRVPPQILANVSRVEIPTYLLNANAASVSPLLPELLNIDGRVPAIPRTTSCLASITKPYSPLREAVDSCAVSYAQQNRRTSSLFHGRK